MYEKEVSLSLLELRLMRLIATHPGRTITRLMEQAHVEKTLTSKAITLLVKQGLVVRAIGEAGARQVNLYLTSEGAARVKKADSIGQNLEAMMMRRLPERDAATFKRCLELLYESSNETAEIAEEYLKQ